MLSLLFFAVFIYRFRCITLLIHCKYIRNNLLFQIFRTKKGYNFSIPYIYCLCGLLWYIWVQKVVEKFADLKNMLTFAVY